jgi:hypothetical protein
MSLAILEQGEDEELGAPFLHFGGEGRLGHMWCDNISVATVVSEMAGLKCEQAGGRKREAGVDGTADAVLEQLGNRRAAAKRTPSPPLFPASGFPLPAKAPLLKRSTRVRIKACPARKGS